MEPKTRKMLESGGIFEHIQDCKTIVKMRVWGASLNKILLSEAPQTLIITVVLQSWMRSRYESE